MPLPVASPGAERAESVSANRPDTRDRAIVRPQLAWRAVNGRKTTRPDAAIGVTNDDGAPASLRSRRWPARAARDESESMRAGGGRLRERAEVPLPDELGVGGRALDNVLQVCLH